MNYFLNMPPIAPPPPPEYTKDGMTTASMIVDTRPASAFGLRTFTGYQKAKVKTELFNSLVTGSTDLAQFWAADLLCSGALLDIRDIIIRVVSKHTVSVNPVLTIYMAKRLHELGRFIDNAEAKLGPVTAESFNADDSSDGDDGSDGEPQGKGRSKAGRQNPSPFIPKPSAVNTATRAVKLRGCMMDMRNQKKIREMVAEILFIVSVSPKTPGIAPIVFESVDEFTHGNMAQRLFAPTPGFASAVRMQEDADEMQIAANEFAYQMVTACENRTKAPEVVQRERMSGGMVAGQRQGQRQGTTLAAVYWVEWTVEFDRLCRARKTPCVCARRLKYAVANKYRTDPIWILWDILLLCSHKYGPSIHTVVPSVLEGLTQMFCVRYTPATAKKERHLLYAAIRLFTEPTDFECPFLSCAVPGTTGADRITDREYGSLLCRHAIDSIHATYTTIQTGYS